MERKKRIRNYYTAQYKEMRLLFESKEDAQVGSQLDICSISEDIAKFI